MSVSKLRRMAIVGFAMSLMVAIASCFGLLTSFLEPMLDLRQLYRMSVLTRGIGFSLLGVYIVSGFAIRTTVGATANVSKWQSKALSIIVLGCFLVVMFSPHTYVYPQPVGWVTKTKAGTFSVSSDVARRYLWRALRMWSAIPFCLSLSAISLTWRIANNSQSAQIQ